MHERDDILGIVLANFKDEYAEYVELINELPYDYEDNKEHIRNEKLRLSKQKAKPVAKPFVRRIRKSQNR